MLNLADTLFERNNLDENIDDRAWWQALADLTAPAAGECASCGRRVCTTPSFCAVCLAADQKADGRKLPDHIPANWDDPDVSLNSLWSRFNGERRSTPQSTIEALLCCVRARGSAALREPANIERLAQCDERARREIDQRINKKLGGDNA